MTFGTMHLKKNRWVWVVTLICLLLCRGGMLFSNVVGIDTEAIIRSPENLLGSWLATGRQGLVFMKDILFEIYNPVYSGICTVIFMMVACYLWTGVFSYVSGTDHVLANLSFSVILSSSVILTEQFYFKLQSMEISLAFCLIAAALQGMFLFAGERKKLGLVIAVPTMFLSFCSYQVMVALFLGGTCICFFLYVMRYMEEGQEKLTLRKVLIFVAKYVVVFLAVFLANQIVTKIWFSQGDYLANQIYWTREEPLTCIWNIFKHVGGVLLGTNIYYCKTFACYVLIFLAFTVLLMSAGKKKNVARPFLALFMIAVLGSPFLMTILLGEQPVVRSQLVLPFIYAFLAYAAFLLMERLTDLAKKGGNRACRHFEKRREAWTVALLILLTGTYLLQVKYSSLLIYSDHVRYQNDVRLAESIMGKLDEMQGEDECPVVFFGKKEAVLNPSCVQGETMGHSFFEWDTEVDPRGYYNSLRVIGFMSTLGREYPAPTMEQVKKAQEMENKMTAWPKEGSVIKQNGVIIVKLSER